MSSGEAGRERQHDGVVLAARNLAAMPVVFLGEFVSLSSTRLQVGQFLSRRYLIDLRAFMVLAPEDVSGRNVFVGDLDGKSELDLADFTGVSIWGVEQVLLSTMAVSESCV